MTPTERAAVVAETEAAIVMVIDGHDWREKVIYHGEYERWRIERVPGQMQCITCGFEKPTGKTPERECYDVWSDLTGYMAAPSIEAIERGEYRGVK